MRIFRPLWLIHLLTLAGCASSAYEGPRSDHFDGERFHNLAPREDKSLWTLLKWQFTRTRPEWTWQEGPAVPTRPVARVEGGELRVTFVNHATLLIQHQGLNILADPVWSERVSPFSFIGPRRYHAPGVALDDLPPLDLIFVSHSHYDHMDLATLRRLAERAPLTPVVTPLGNAELIRRETGFVTVSELDWWQSLPLKDGLRLHLVPGQHWSARSRFDTNRRLWGGFVLEAPTGPVYFAGDTGWGPHFAQIRERLGTPRFAALPIGAYEPRWFMRDSHLNPDDAVRAHQALGAVSSLGIHFGTFSLSDEEQFAPPRDLAHARALHGLADEAFRTLAPGEVWSVP